jgi:hypothetical protein
VSFNVSSAMPISLARNDNRLAMLTKSALNHC